MKRKKLAIASTAASMLVLLLWLAGCSDESGQPQPGAAEANTNRDSAAVEARERQIERTAARQGVDIDVELDDSAESADTVTVNHDVAGYTGQYGSSIALPEGFPDDIPVPEGLTLFANSKIPGGFMLQGRSSQDSEALKAFFTEAAVEAGWQAGQSGVAGPIHQLQFDSGNRKLGVTITETGNERIVQISTMEMPQG